MASSVINVPIIVKSETSFVVNYNSGGIVINLTKNSIDEIKQNFVIEYKKLSNIVNNKVKFSYNLVNE